MEAFISSMITSLALYIIGNLIYYRKQKITISDIIYTVVFGLIVYIINLTDASFLDNLVKIMILFVGFIGYYKIVFNEEISKLILGSLITYIIFFFAEGVADLCLYIVFFIIKNNNMASMRHSLIMNILINSLSIILVKNNRQKLLKLMNVTITNQRILLIISGLILIALSLLIFKTPVNELKLDTNFIVMITLLIVFGAIGFVLIRQRIETEKVLDKYRKLSDYAQNNEGLLEEYRLNLHESKNQLVIVNNMVPKKYKEIHEYIESLIEKQKANKYYWLNELKYIPVPELKGFMNYKIMEMINKGLNVEIDISHEINKKVFQKYKVQDKEDLYSIIGVLLDNAYEASKESKEKELAVQMFMENKKMKLIVANTYKGTIDLTKINEYGYSSKGPNRGTGLYLVNKIVEKNELFKVESSLLDNYFVQTIIISSKK